MEFYITRLGHQGDGIADGPIFAAGTLPGERVSGVPDADRVTDIRILEPSAHRVVPPCRHYKACGGCQVMHGSDAFVADWKSDTVAAALRARGLQAEVTKPVTSPPRSRRRATFSAKRTKKGAMVGFHGRASGTIVDVTDCMVIDGQLAGALRAVAALAIHGASRRAEISATVTASPAGPDVAVRGGKPLDGPLRAVLGNVCAEFGLARLSWEDETVATAAPMDVPMGRAKVTPPPGAFLQATPQGEAALVGAVREMLAGAKQLVDLFSGCGTFALPLAETAEVHAVESDAAMLDALDAGWRGAQGLKRVTHDARDLFRRPLMADELAKFDGAVIDPPRAGAAAQIEQIAASDLPRLAHVSCNPVTFARDAAALVAGGYRMGTVRVVDQFRWSSHVEIVAPFTRA